MTTEAALLADRSLLEVAGEDRVSFLQGLITSSVDKLAPGAACFAGLCSPQGKILFDFFAINQGEAILLDCPTAIASDLLKRLGFYRIRAKIALSDVSERWRVAAAWGEGAGAFFEGRAAIAYPDPRLSALGFRALMADAGTLPASGDYEAMRVAATVPEGGKDFTYGDTFPHEACFDLLQGVNFKKGCYVGQEVVSRMQHRGTARTRVLAALGDAALPAGGADILVDGFAIGRLGSVAGRKGIALARLDRVGDAMAKGQTLTAGGVPVTLSVPGWATYTFPATAGAAP
jgi:folate-binding protein YgfZ